MSNPKLPIKDIAKLKSNTTSITEKIEILKCSKPKYFSRTTRKVFDKFAEETKDWNHEKALYVDNEGNILWEKEGNTNSVSLDERLAWKISDPHDTSWHQGEGIGYGQINIEHNHPTIPGFEAFPPVLSIGDTSKLLSYSNEGYLFRSITAESNGKRMSLIRSPNINAETSMYNGEFDYKGYRQASEHLDKAIDKYIKMYGDKLSELNNIPTDELKTKIGNGQIKTNYDMSQQALDEIGSLQSFLDSEGVTKELEDVGVNILLEE